MTTITDGFRAMILREFYLEPRLPDEFKAATFLHWFGRTVSKPAAYLVAAKFGIPPTLVEQPVRFACGLQNTTLMARAFSDWLASLASPRNNYESCCRSALCYAITNSYEWAFGALRNAATRNDGWARHHHIYGLLHGERGDFERAVFELAKALDAESYADTRGRIEEAAQLARRGDELRALAPVNSDHALDNWKWASDAIETVLELIVQVRT